MARTAISYIRFSTLEQQQGGSLERQRRGIREFSERNGWTLSQEYFDKGKSAFKAAHREASAALGCLESEARDGTHEGAVLVIEKLDRLSRLEPMETLDLFRHFHRNKVDIAIATTGAIYRSDEPLPIDQLLMLIIEAHASFQFSKTLQDRVSKGFAISREKARANGTVLTRRLPLWLMVDEHNRAIAIAERAAIVRRIFELADTGMGTRAIVRQLEAEDVKTFGKSKVWQRSYVIKLLQNRAVVGEFQPTVLVSGKRVPVGQPWRGHFPAVVDEAMFARVNAASPSRARAKGGRSDKQFSNLFSGLAFCKGCGGTIRYALNRKAGTSRFDSRRGRSYEIKRDQGNLHCRNARDSGGIACANSRHWSYLRFEDAVTKALLHLAMDDMAFANRGEVGRVRSLIAERQRQLEIAETKAKRLWDAYAASGSENAMGLAQECDAETSELKLNIEGLARQLSEASGRASSAEHLRRVEDMRNDLHCPDDEQRIAARRKVMTAMAALIDRIVMSGDIARVQLSGNAGSILVDHRGKVSGLNTIKSLDDVPADFARRYLEAEESGTLPWKNGVKFNR